METSQYKLFHEIIKDWKDRAISLLQIESAIITIFTSGLTISMTITQGNIYPLLPVILVHIVSIILIVYSMIILLSLVKSEKYDISGDPNQILFKFSGKLNIAIYTLIISLVLESIVAPLAYLALIMA